MTKNRLNPKALWKVQQLALLTWSLSKSSTKWQSSALAWQTAAAAVGRLVNEHRPHRANSGRLARGDQRHGEQTGFSTVVSNAKGMSWGRKKKNVARGAVLAGRQQVAGG